MNGEERIRAIVLARKKLPQLELLKLMKQPGLFTKHFLFRFRALSGIRFLRRKLPQRFEIADGALELTKRIQQRSQARNLLNVALRALAVRPEIGRAHPLLERPELAF